MPVKDRRASSTCNQLLIGVFIRNAKLARNDRD